MTINDPDYGYLLHSRPLRDTSLIGEFFLRRHGRVSIVYKHLKKDGRQGAKARLLQPFAPLAISFEGKHELKSGRMLEAAAAAVMLSGAALFSGLYLNELLMRLLHREESFPALFQHYESTLRLLQNIPPEIPLRRFEHNLLLELGYELVLDRDTDGHPVQAELHYLYEADSGFVRLTQLPPEPARLRLCFSGAHLLEIHRQAYEDSNVRAAAKQLSRLALAPHLGDKPLHSRDLFLPPGKR
jgi:DNA repair protein RecO (recombination protein O)